MTAHFPELADSCACPACAQNRRVKNVTNKLMGIHKKNQNYSLVFKLKNGSYRFGFSGWKDLLNNKDDSKNATPYLINVETNEITAPSRSTMKRVLDDHLKPAPGHSHPREQKRRPEAYRAVVS